MSSNELQFHIVIAQIIPVLLLAGTVQSSSILSKNMPNFDPVSHVMAIATFVFVMGYGEYLALTAILHNHTTTGTIILECMALGLGAYLIVAESALRIAGIRSLSYMLFTTVPLLLLLVAAFYVSRYL